MGVRVARLVPQKSEQSSERQSVQVGKLIRSERQSIRSERQSVRSERQSVQVDTRAPKTKDIKVTNITNEKKLKHVAVHRSGYVKERQQHQQHQQRGEEEEEEEEEEEDIGRGISKGNEGFKPLVKTKDAQVDLVIDNDFFNILFPRWLCTRWLE